MKRLFGLLLVPLACLALPPAVARAQAQVYVSQFAAASADHIVNGTVVSTTNVVLDGQPHRVSEFSISSTLKGSAGNSILVEVPGGELPDGTVMWVSHTPDLIAGERVQLALGPTESNARGLALALRSPHLDVYAVAGGSEGAYGLLPDGVGRASAVGDFALHGSSIPSFVPPIKFRVNPVNSGVSSDATISAVQQAFQLWEDDPGSLVDFAYDGTTTKSGVNLSDRQNVVSWVDTSAGWLAQASWIATAGGDILEFDVRVNRQYPWATGAVNGQWDITTVVAHEVGHGIGFDHAPASTELMYSTIPLGQTMGLGAGDRSGLEFLYPASGARPGDVNCTGVVNIADALVIAQYTVGNREAVSVCPLDDPTTQINIAAADTSGDGNINIVDALFVAQCTVGIPNNLCPE